MPRYETSGSTGAAAKIASCAERMRYPVTPDGRYFVVRGRLWRMSDPGIPDDDRKHLTSELMSARRAVGAAKRASDSKAEDAAHEAVDVAKRALGERGQVWWDDSAPDFNRHMARTTPYSDWFAELSSSE